MVGIVWFFCRISIRISIVVWINNKKMGFLVDFVVGLMRYFVLLKIV